MPGNGPQRFAERSAFLAQEPQRRVWLEWRAAQLGKFYRRAYEELVAIRPGSRLYLAGAGMFGGPELEAELRPTLPRRTHDRRGAAAGGHRRPPLSGRPATDRAVAAGTHPAAGQSGRRAADLEIGQMADFDRYFQTAGVAGSLFFHQPREVRIESFDEKSPFKPSYTWLVSQPCPRASRIGGGSSTAWPRSTPR